MIVFVVGCYPYISFTSAHSIFLVRALHHNAAIIPALSVPGYSLNSVIREPSLFAFHYPKTAYNRSVFLDDNHAVLILLN